MNKVAQIPFTDPVYIKKDRLSWLDNFILRFIRDERDIVFVHTMLKMALIIIPAAAFLFIPGRFSVWFSVIYLSVNWMFFTPPYILMLHCTSHRPLFKRKYDWMNKIIPWFFGPFFGETPETYFG
ncbi:fatty acid desaturase, partial [Bacteroidota bacterium]